MWGSTAAVDFPREFEKASRINSKPPNQVEITGNPTNI